MKIALYGRNITAENATHISKLIELLMAKKAHIIIEENYNFHLQNAHIPIAHFETFSTKQKLPKNTDLLLSIGGDGTLLDTLMFVADTCIPILGINAGRLGFLTGVNKDNIETALTEVLNGSFKLDKRKLIQLDSNIPLFGNAPYALNELTIHKKDTSSMIVIHTYLNGEFLTSYWADGLIISTSTGSTAYNLSCGGPILIPTSENFVITPISPHNLNIRPIVVPDTSILSFEIEGRADFFNCTLDSRMATIDNTIQLAVKQADFTLNLVKLNDTNFLQTLAQKLNWGKDTRN